MGIQINGQTDNITSSDTDVNVGTGITFYHAVGIISATSFYGDGSNLTGAGPTLSNGSNDRVVTASSATALNGEANLTFDGTQLSVTGSGTPPVYIGGANPGIKFEDTNASGTPLSYIYASDGQLSLRADDGNETGSSHIEFKVDGSEKLRIDSSGNIGAGTASPSSFSATDLVISKSANAGITISVGNAGTTNTASIFFAEGTGGTGDKERGAIKYKHGDDYLAFHTNATENLRIDSTGKVGIGRTNPGHLLHLQSSNTDDYVANTATNNTMLMLANSGAVGANHCVSLGFNGTSTNGEGYISLVAEDTSNSDLRFSLRRGGSRQDVFTMHSNGDITVPSGSIKLSESGQGINFHNFGSGSGVSNNLLNDYEEGTWDPTVGGWDTFSPYSGSSYDYGWYVKIGALVYFGWKIYIQNLTTLSTSGSGPHIRFTGLPFASKDVTSQTGPNVRFDIPEFGTENYVWSYIGGNDTTVYMYSQASGAGSSTALNATGNRSNAWTMAWGSYMTNA